VFSCLHLLLAFALCTLLLVYLHVKPKKQIDKLLILFIAKSPSYFGLFCLIKTTGFRFPILELKPKKAATP